MTTKINAWRLEDGRIIYLLTREELAALDKGASITSIMGDERLVGDPNLGPPDGDTRFGYTAWGLTPNS